MSYPQFTHDALYDAIKRYLEVRGKVFRSHAMGSVGSAARLNQDVQILAEDALLRAMADHESSRPGQTGGRSLG